jgi:D-sedoheptulose 7-phosphate isomerase
MKMDKMNLILNELIRDYPRLEVVREDIAGAYLALEACYANKKRVFICGNGGSAADALHIVGELMKSFTAVRPIDNETAKRLLTACPDQADYLIEHIQGALPAYALVENAALCSAFANDVKADLVFAQQLYGYAQEGDVLLAISTSGNAANVLNAICLARAMGIVTLGLTGGTGGALKAACDICMVMPERETYRIQELHLPVYHALCRMIEARFFA